MRQTKNIFIIIAILVMIAAIAAYWFAKPEKEIVQIADVPGYVLDQKNCSYLIEGQNITLKDGHLEMDITSSSSSKLVTDYFGNDISGDFNDDGIGDVAFLLTQDSSGSGTFFYLAAALGGNDQCMGTNAILLGDRIAPQNVGFSNGEIIANYAERKQDEPMAESPSTGVSRYFRVIDSQLSEVNR